MDKNELRNTINEFSSYVNKILSLLNRLEENLDNNTEEENDIIKTVENLIDSNKKNNKEKYQISYPFSMLEWLCEHDDLTGYEKTKEEKCVTYKEFEAIKEKELDNSAEEKNKSVTKEIFFNKVKPPFQKALNVLLKADNLTKDLLWAIPLSSEGIEGEEIRKLLEGGTSSLSTSSEDEEYLKALSSSCSIPVQFKNGDKYKMIMEDSSFNSIVDEIAAGEVKNLCTNEKQIMPRTQIKFDLVKFFHSAAFWSLFYSFVKDNIYCNDVLSKAEYYKGLEILNNCNTFEVGEIILFLDKKRKEYEELFFNNDPLEVTF